MSSEIDSVQEAGMPGLSSVDQLAYWQQCLDIWEAEVDQAKFQNLSVEKIASFLRTLCEIMRSLTRGAADLLNADRASIFLLDQSRQALVSIIAEDGSGGSLVIEIPSEGSIAGTAASSKKVINIPFDVYEDPRSGAAQKTDKKTAYRTYSILALPLLNEQNDLVAVVQFINKLKPNYNPEDKLSRRIDIQGFTGEDEALFAKFSPAILQTMKRCQDCYLITQKLRENAAVPDNVFL